MFETTFFHLLLLGYIYINFFYMFWLYIDYGYILRDCSSMVT